MKLTKRKLLFPISILATAVISGGIAYALSSLDFANQAASWAKANCTSNLASSKYNTTNGQKSIICYNYNKNAEQDVAINNLNSTTNSINNSMPRLVDANGKVLGVATDVNEDYNFYDSSLKLFVHMDAKGQLADFVYLAYPSNDCSGKAYREYQVYKGKLYMAMNTQPIKYFKADSDISTRQYIKSRLEVGGVCVKYNPNQPADAWPLTEVTPSTSFPVALPVSLQ